MAASTLASRSIDREEGQLLHVDVAPLGQPYRHGGLADDALVREILTRRDDVPDVEVAGEVVFDLGARSRFGHVPQVLDEWGEQRSGPGGEIVVDRFECRPDRLRGLLLIKKVRVDPREEVRV